MHFISLWFALSILGASNVDTGSGDNGSFGSAYAPDQNNKQSTTIQPPAVQGKSSTLGEINEKTSMISANRGDKQLLIPKMNQATNGIPSTVSNGANIPTGGPINNQNRGVGNAPVSNTSSVGTKQNYLNTPLTSQPTSVQGSASLNNLGTNVGTVTRGFNRYQQPLSIASPSQVPAKSLQDNLSGRAAESEETLLSRLREGGWDASTEFPSDNDELQMRSEGEFLSDAGEKAALMEFQLYGMKQLIVAEIGLSLIEQQVLGYLAIKMEVLRIRTLQQKVQAAQSALLEHSQQVQETFSQRMAEFRSKPVDQPAAPSQEREKARKALQDKYANLAILNKGQR